jgi:hypothetical protein
MMMEMVMEMEMELCFQNDLEQVKVEVEIVILQAILTTVNFLHLMFEKIDLEALVELGELAMLFPRPVAAIMQ